MSAETKSVAKKVRKPKVVSEVRKAAEAKLELARKNVEAAKSPQEKTVAESALKEAHASLKGIKFSEIAVPRVTRAINALRMVENLANRNAYAWTPEQTTKILDAVDKAYVTLRDKLNSSKKDVAKFSW